MNDPNSAIFCGEFIEETRDIRVARRVIGDAKPPMRVALRDDRFDGLPQEFDRRIVDWHDNGYERLNRQTGDMSANDQAVKLAKLGVEQDSILAPTIFLVSGYALHTSVHNG